MRLGQKNQNSEIHHEKDMQIFHEIPHCPVEVEETQELEMLPISPKHLFSAHVYYIPEVEKDDKNLLPLPLR